MSLVQVFHCNRCGFAFGPVGVKPYNPQAETQQMFLVCRQCRSPAAIDDVPGMITRTCSVCDARDWESLVQCPECHSSEATWRTPGEVAMLGAQLVAKRRAEGTLEPDYAIPAGSPMDDEVQRMLDEMDAEDAEFAASQQDEPAEQPADPAPRGALAAAGPDSMPILYVKMHGCLVLMLAVCTLGVANLVIWLSRRKWPVYADNAGVVLGNGTHIPWSSTRKVTHVTTKIAGGAHVHRFSVDYEGGRWELPYERLVEPEKVLNFILARVPQG